MRVGDRVAKGDVLVRLGPETMQTQRDQAAAALAARQAELDMAQTQVDRSARLAKKGVSASAVLDTANSNLAVKRANVALGRANVQAADIALRNVTLAAPFDGIVARRMVEPGQTVSPADPLLELADLSVMSAEITLPVAQSVRLQPGQKVVLDADGLADQHFSGNIGGDRSGRQRGQQERCGNCHD